MTEYRRIIALAPLLIGLAAGRGDAAALDPTSPLFTAYTQGDVSLSSGNYVFELGTDRPSLVFFNGPLFTTVATGFVYNGINVFDFHSLQVASGANIFVNQSSASGPIALLSSTSINMGGSIDVSAGPFVGNGFSGGPGAGNTGVGGNGNLGTTGTGGPGGAIPTGGGGGGFGGFGQQGQSAPIFDPFTHMQVGTVPGGVGGGGVYESLADRLQGGSMGGFGGNSNFYGGGLFVPGGPGSGGGAIELGAVQTVSISGMILANGSQPVTGGTQTVGPGGGGSGGGVFLHGNSVDLSGTISASGGAGGSGRSNGGVGSGGLVLAEFSGSFGDSGTVNVGSGPYAGRFDVASVPEPSSLILLGISAMVGVAATRSRWSRRSS